MPALNFSPVTRSCSIPMELTSMKQYSHPSSAICLSRELMVIGSAVVLAVSNRLSPT